MFIGMSCGRSESVPALQLIVMMLRVLAQLFAFTRFPFMSGTVLKMSVSPETSSQNGDVQIGSEIFGSSKMGFSPETSSKKLDVEKAAFRPRMPKMSVSPETSSENEDIENARLMFGS